MTFALPTYLPPVDLDGGFFLPGRGFAAQNDLGGHDAHVDRVRRHLREEPRGADLLHRDDLRLRLLASG